MPRLFVLEGETAHEVFDVLETSSNVIQVRSAFLFEIGEEFGVRIEQDGSTSDATARVRTHIGTGDERVTELEISDRSEPSRATNP